MAYGLMLGNKQFTKFNSNPKNKYGLFGSGKELDLTKFGIVESRSTMNRQFNIPNYSQIDSYIADDLYIVFNQNIYLGGVL